MTLLIDCGNTRLKWCVSDNGSLHSFGCVLVDCISVPDLVSQLPMDSFDRVMLASVKVSEKIEALVCSLESEFHKEVRVLGHDSLQAHEFAYQQVERLGIDRCLVITALRSRGHQGGVVVDSGSAMTADYVLPSGEHIGGYIFPGCKMLHDSLIKGTSKVIVEKESKRSVEPGKDTESCVANAVEVMIGQTLKYLERDARKYGVSEVYLTGGDAEYLADFFEGDPEICPEMVFEGMQSLIGTVFEGERVQ